MKTAELTGAQLDYWVAKASGMAADIWNVSATEPDVCVAENRFSFQPSTKWAQGGPLIEREKIDIVSSYSARENATTWIVPSDWKDGCMVTGDNHIASGPTPLIAAMRAFVASKFGDEVPDE